MCQRCWQHGSSADPVASLRGWQHTELVLSLALQHQPGPQHVAMARVPGQHRGCGSRRAAGRGKSAFPLLLVPGERASFLIQGFTDQAFQLPLEPRLLCHWVGDKRHQEKKEKRQIETARLGSAATVGNGECGIWFLCLNGLTAFFFFYYGRLLWQHRSLPRHEQ